jgi:hypothetical protein
MRACDMKEHIKDGRHISHDAGNTFVNLIKYCIYIIDLSYS